MRKTKLSDTVGRSSPYYEDMWGDIAVEQVFFPIVDTCLTCEDIARQSCAICPDGKFLAFLGVLHCTFQTCILNSRQDHIMCRSMVDIQSATAEIRRGKKEERRRNKQDENIMSASATQGGHKKEEQTTG